MRTLLLLGLLAGAALAQHPLVLATAGHLKNDPHFKMSAEPVAKYLEAGLGRPVHLENFPGYEEVLAKLAAGGVDVAILPPIVNIQATERNLTRPLAYGIYPSGGYTYRAYLLAKKDDSRVKALADLKGKQVGFVDRSSASGYIYPKCLLADHGLAAADVKDVFCGGHLEALQALEAGKVDAASVYELLFDKENGGGKSLDDYRVLGTTDPIPAEVVVATPRLAQADAERVQDLLYAFHSRRGEKPDWKQGRYIGFIPPDPFVLVGVRRAYHRVVGGPAEAR